MLTAPKCAKYCIFGVYSTIIIHFCRRFFKEQILEDILQLTHCNLEINDLEISTIFANGILLHVRDAWSYDVVK